MVAIVRILREHRLPVSARHVRHVACDAVVVHRGVLGRVIPARRCLLACVHVLIAIARKTDSKTLVLKRAPTMSNPSGRLEKQEKLKALAPVYSKSLKNIPLKKLFRKFFTSSMDEVCGSSFSGSFKNQVRISISFLVSEKKV